jgi:hypothetical protein
MEKTNGPNRQAVLTIAFFKFNSTKNVNKDGRECRISTVPPITAAIGKLLLFKQGLPKLPLISKLPLIKPPRSSLMMTPDWSVQTLDHECDQ